MSFCWFWHAQLVFCWFWHAQLVYAHVAELLLTTHNCNCQGLYYGKLVLSVVSWLHPSLTVGTLSAQLLFKIRKDLFGNLQTICHHTSLRILVWPHSQITFVFFFFFFFFFFFKFWRMPFWQWMPLRFSYIVRTCMWSSLKGIKNR